MSDNIGSSAMRVREALTTQGNLNLWQIQAILGRSREYSLEVLSRLFCQRDVNLSREDERLLVTLNRKR